MGAFQEGDGMKMRSTMLGMAVLAIGLMTAGEASARGGRCGGGGGFFNRGGHCGGGQVVSHCGGGQVQWGQPVYQPSYQPTYVQGCQACQQQGVVQWGQPIPQYGPAPLPSSTYGQPMYIVPSNQTVPRIEEIPPQPKKTGPAPLPSKETSSNTGPTYYLINGQLYLVSN